MTARRDTAGRTITVIMGTVVGRTFMFGFGNVLGLALRLGVPLYVAPLVAPAVDLSVLGLLLGTRYLALHGAIAAQLRPAKRLPLFASTVTLALNVAEPIYAGHLGKASFDAIGPLLLIGWAEVGPTLLQAIQHLDQNRESGPANFTDTAGSHDTTAVHDDARSDPADPRRTLSTVKPAAPLPAPAALHRKPEQGMSDPLLTSAYQLDAEHWLAVQRPISAETLRKRLRIGATRSRHLVAHVCEHPTARDESH